MTALRYCLEKYQKLEQEIYFKEINNIKYSINTNKEEEKLLLGCW